MDQHDHYSLWKDFFSMQSTLKKLSDDQDTSDIVFVGDQGREFHCHKNVLALFTDLFKASCSFRTLSHGEEEKITRIKLKDLDISESTFANIRDIMYAMEPKITADELVDVLFDADKLLMDGVRTYAEDIIIKENYLQLQFQQLVRVCNFPGLTRCQMLIDNVKEHVYSNFGIITVMPEFFQISLDTLFCLGVLKKNNLFQSSITCINFIGQWIMYDIDNRILEIEKIYKYLNDQSANQDIAVLNKFLTAFHNLRKNEKDMDAIVSLLRLSLHGLFLENVHKSYFKAEFSRDCQACRSGFAFNNVRSQCCKCGKAFSKYRFLLPTYTEWFDLNNNAHSQNDESKDSKDS